MQVRSPPPPPPPPPPSQAELSPHDFSHSSHPLSRRQSPSHCAHQGAVWLQPEVRLWRGTGPSKQRGLAAAAHRAFSFPSEWLGVICAGLLYQDFSNAKNFKSSMAQLLREIESHAKEGESAKSAKVAGERGASLPFFFFQHADRLFTQCTHPPGSHAPVRHWQRKRMV